MFNVKRILELINVNEIYKWWYAFNSRSVCQVSRKSFKSTDTGTPELIYEL
jgi:hypothetical protein